MQVYSSVKNSSELGEVSCFYMLPLVKISSGVVAGNDESLKYLQITWGVTFDATLRLSRPFFSWSNVPPNCFRVTQARCSWCTSVSSLRCGRRFAAAQAQKRQPLQSQPSDTLADNFNGRYINATGNMLTHTPAIICDILIHWHISKASLGTKSIATYSED